jgi:2-iminobutanoate/2-iminopropanoate deaminase
MKAIRAPELSPPVGPFSQAIASGGYVFLSGQVGQDPATGRMVEGGVEAEAEQVLANITRVLQAAGLGLSDVVRVGIYLLDIADFAAVNQVYARHFAEPYPARTTVAVAALPLGARIEIDLVAKERA